MILALAVILGLLAGWIRARFGKRKLQLPTLRHNWLVLVAVIPQILAFEIPATRSVIPDNYIPVILVVSQLLLLIFAWINLRQPGFVFLNLGLVLNLIVITLNGGWMPIRPEVVMKLAPDAPPGAWKIGERMGTSKDRVISVSDIRLWQLSDRFLFPTWFPLQVAFSMGDVFIALGAFWFFWSLGGPARG